MQAVAQKIVVLGTGGTIAGTADSAQDTLGYTAAQLGIGELLAQAPGLQGIGIVAEQVSQIDSKDMDCDIWRQLALRCAFWLARDDIQGVVITHGTDTMEETAYFLDRVLAPAKPVVMTGAMRPATAERPDGPRNLADAMAVALAPGAQGVVVVFAGQVHAALHVAKVHSHRLDAFDSGDQAPVARVAGGMVSVTGAWPASADVQAVLAKVERASSWPRVEIVMNYAGAGGDIVRLLAAAGVDGIVVAGTGNGTLAAPLEAALVAAGRSGVRIVRASRCAYGGVLPHGGDVLPGAGGLSAVKARVAMLLELLEAA